MWPAVGSWRPDGAATNRGAMAARSKKPTGGRRQAIDADAVVAEYAAWPPAVGRPEPGRLPGPDARLPSPGWPATWSVLAVVHSSLAWRQTLLRGTSRVGVALPRANPQPTPAGRDRQIAHLEGGQLGEAQPGVEEH